MIKAFGEAGHLHQVRELWAQLRLGFRLEWRNRVATCDSEAEPQCEADGYHYRLRGGGFGD